MKITLCDRCGEVVYDYVISCGYSVYQKDLCQSCADELKIWMDKCPKTTRVFE